VELKQDELLPVIKQCVFHSILKDHIEVSGIHVRLPIWGNMDHIATLQRRFSAEVNADNEENFAPLYFQSQLKYLLSQATAYEEPVYQTSEDGEEVHIGNSVIFIDRPRLCFPKVETDEDGNLFLNCIKS
jgi:hypothetical protein